MKYKLCNRLTLAIPARIGSSRLPGKLLHLINGKPVLWHVLSAASEYCKQQKSCSVILVHDGLLAFQELADEFGIDHVTTPPDVPSPERRIAQILEPTDENQFVLFLMGDEPTITSKDISDYVSDAMNEMKDPKNDVCIACRKQAPNDDLSDPSMIKLWTNGNRVLNVTRAQVPAKEGTKSNYLHKVFVGLVLLRATVLPHFLDHIAASDATATLSQHSSEDSDTIAYVEMGCKITCCEMKDHKCNSVNTARDLASARLEMHNGSQKEPAVIFVDVDGVLTDGMLRYTSDNGRCAERQISARDGPILRHMARVGIPVVLLSSARKDVSVQSRGADIEVFDCLMDAKDKKAVAREWLKKYNLDLQCAAFVGDDCVVDGEIARLCGWSACPKDADVVLQNCVDYVSPFSGGKGAVKDIVFQFFPSVKQHFEGNGGRGKVVELLDTTIRDGGYVTDWDFSIDFCKEWTSICDKIGVRFCEIGFFGAEPSYRSDGSPAPFWRHLETDPGTTKLIAQGLKTTKLAALIEAAKFEQSAIPLACDSGISLVRVSARPVDFAEARRALAKLKEMGYLTSFNLIRSSALKQRDFCIVGKILNDETSDFVAFADTCGTLHPAQVHCIAQKLLLLAEKTKTEVGFHGHDNLGMGAANSLRAIESGCSLVDGTLRGLGRGGGNTPLESLCLHLGTRFDHIHPQHLLTFSSTYATLGHFQRLGEAIIGHFDIHPDWLCYLQNKGMSDIQSLWSFAECLAQEFSQYTGKNGISDALFHQIRKSSAQTPAKPLKQAKAEV